MEEKAYFRNTRDFLCYHLDVQMNPAIAAEVAQTIIARLKDSVSFREEMKNELRAEMEEEFRKSHIG